MWASSSGILWSIDGLESSGRTLPQLPVLQEPLRPPEKQEAPAVGDGGNYQLELLADIRPLGTRQVRTFVLNVSSLHALHQARVSGGSIATSKRNGKMRIAEKFACTANL
jgi:hypothetical protein